MPSCSKEEFTELFESHPPTKVAEILGISLRSVYLRRRAVEQQIKRALVSPRPSHSTVPTLPNHPGRLLDEIKDGHLLLGTDSHYLPGVTTDAHKAFVKFAREFKPQIIIKNGDEFDFPAISRWPGTWEKRPTVQQELEWTTEKLEEIRQASKNSRCYFPIGNHDYRFELRLAAVAGPEFKGVKGMHLKDHVPGWRPCWSVWINDDTVVKHRFKTGLTAARLNTLLAGKHLFTGHTHRLQTYFFAEYNGVRFGMECGTMADPYTEPFLYMEENPREWVQGFVLLTFHKGKLLPPESILCQGNGTYAFRGRVYTL